MDMKSRVEKVRLLAPIVVLVVILTLSVPGVPAGLAQESSPVIWQVQVWEGDRTGLSNPLINDSGTWQDIPWQTISDAPHVLEIDWIGATGAASTACASAPCTGSIQARAEPTISMPSNHDGSPILVPNKVLRTRTQGCWEPGFCCQHP